MRRIATIAAAMALPLMGAAAAAQAQPPVAQQPRGGGAANPGLLGLPAATAGATIGISLVAISTLIVGFSAAVRNSNPGTPASP